MSARLEALESRLVNLPDWKLAYRIDEAAVAIGLSRSALFERIGDGRISARKDGKITLIERVELDRYLKSLPRTKNASVAA
ncbi:MAG TPA: hypothetical protein VHW02_07655 [Rhizomicrobium sp.]|jgi:excisionase family DNA binding protein|nr:hypothetical protein [Rhizomicrobium sp.]